MSTDHRKVRTRPVAVAAALSTVFFATAFPGTATADTETETVSPTERIVAELEESPVHVDPSFSSALPEERADALEERIEGSDVPLRVLAVPLIEGGDWSGQADQMVAAVHDRIGGEAHYLVLDGRSVSGHDFGTGNDESGSRAFYSALTVSYEFEYDSPAVDKLERSVEIALSKDPKALYDEAVESQEKGPIDWVHSLGPWGYTLVTILPWLVAVLALVGLGFGVYRWRRPRAVPTVPQHAAFDNADLARRGELVRKAERELVELGERVGSARTAPDDSGATEALGRALDAHAAARNVFDGLPEEGATEDIAGVLVLLDMAEDHMARALLPAQRRGSARTRSHCYANPLHGTDVKVTRWREFGGSADIRVPLCAVCAKAVRDRIRPTVLAARYRGRKVPYYEVPAEESVWAATGYGALRDDLVERVLRGDHAGRR
ncbi:hypothetical protein [Nocardiopsis listeri]|uniref:hypothetical protein n=1 Tax=Nocardiopsis listeri TaxID=53440 RepID=UPI000836F23B|nr:hypothetical protein [Nocardiopsis listeri]